MHGWLVVNHFLRSGSFAEMEKILCCSAQKRQITLETHTNAELLTLLPDNLWLTARGKPDFVLFWDKDVHLARLLEKKGIPVYNSAEAIAVCDDKTLTHLMLSGSGIPTPQTILCPLTFAGLGYGNVDFLYEAERALHYPMVIKEGCGSFGQQVYLAQNHEEAKEILARVAGKSALMQEYIEEAKGRDIRVYVVNGRAVAAIERHSENGDFRANIERGGHAQKHDLTREEEEMAVNTCRVLGLDFAGVDLLSSRRGALLCEVNSNAHFSGLIKATGVNPANDIFQMIGEKVCLHG